MLRPQRAHGQSSSSCEAWDGHLAPGGDAAPGVSGFWGSLGVRFRVLGFRDSGLKGVGSWGVIGGLQD